MSAWNTSFEIPVKKIFSSRPNSLDPTHRFTYSTTEEALRQLVVDLTGQNANLRVDLETAVQARASSDLLCMQVVLILTHKNQKILVMSTCAKLKFVLQEGMKYREMLREWAALEQQKILDENLRNERTGKREALGHTGPLQGLTVSTLESAEINDLLIRAARIQSLLDDTQKLCAANDTSMAAYAQGLHHLSQDAHQLDVRVVAARREEHLLKSELAQMAQQYNESTQQLQGEIQARDSRIRALTEKAQQLAFQVDALGSERQRQDTAAADAVAAHLRELRARDATIDALRQQAARLSTERAMANVAHEQALKDLRLRLDQVPRGTHAGAPARMPACL